MRQNARPQPRRADARIRKKNIVGVLMTVCVAAMLFAAVAAFAVLRPPALDEMTGCAKGLPPASLTVVLVDVSDPLTKRQDADVRKRLDELRDAIAAGGRVEIYALAETPSALLAPITVVCNPGDAKTVNPLFASPKIAEDRWRQGFAEPFGHAIEKSLRAGKSQMSPILEAIQSVAVTALSRAEYQSVDRHLIVVSDFVQNVPELNQYKGVRPFEKVARTPYYRRVRADLRAVQVDLLYLNRDLKNNPQGRGHAEFWMELLLDEGARPVIKSIQG